MQRKLSAKPDFSFTFMALSGSGAAILLIGLLGCDLPASWTTSGSSSTTTTHASGVSQDKPAPLVEIVAQGVLEPRNGVLAIMAPPGDRVAKILVSTGDYVEKGTPLLELESLRAKEVELEIARSRLTEGKARFLAETAATEAKLKVAEINLRQAQTQLDQARKRLNLAKSSGGNLDLLRQAADLGQQKLDRLRLASNDPSRSRLVSDSQLDQESLRVSQARAQYEDAESEANQAIESGEMGVEVAKQEIQAAELSMKAAQASSSMNSLEKQIELLELNIQTARLASPITAQVLAIDALVGQATATMPLMHLADTSEMVCVAEVNVADLVRVQVGQEAVIRSPGLSEDLRGSVQRINMMIATPNIPSPFPMAPVDRHTAEVVIAIASESNEFAANMIQLQTEVTIHTGESAPEVSNSENQAPASSIEQTPIQQSPEQLPSTDSVNDGNG